MASTETTAESRPTKKFLFVAGDLCLDFCNTMGGKRGVVPREFLNSFWDFVSWCEQAKLVDRRQGDAMAARASRRPANGASVLTRAVALREAMYRIFLEVAEEKTPAPADLAQLNRELAGALGRLRVAPAKRGYAWEWAPDGDELDGPLGPIARSAAELLTSPGLLAHVRQCGGDTCGWLFIDASKNHSRRWCDMRDCGNRAKVRRFRSKLHEADEKSKITR
jgi:predicted RNA-binding Zn ribbon-like protein